MKTAITVEEVLELSESGRDALRDLWIPQKYDRAVYLACTDVENDIYVPMEFVIGEIQVEAVNEDKRYVVSGRPASAYQYHRLRIRPLMLPDEIAAGADADPGAFDDAGTANAVFLPFVVEKSDCLPLLDIGQMIDLLCQRVYPHEEVHIAFSPEEGVYRVGRRSWMQGEPEYEYEATELCDALWEALGACM